METFTAEPYVDIKCGLSEGPFWEADANILRFVDIVAKAVYRVDLSKGPSSLKKEVYEHPISFTAELDGAPDSFIFGGKHGIGIGKKASNETRLVRRWWTEEERAQGKDENFRANDGGVDSKGRFWASACRDPEVTTFAPEAILFRLDLDGTLHRVIERATIPNGMSWSLDNKTMYWTNTSEATIFAFDFDEASGDVSNKRPFFCPDDGNPDGHAQDEQGNLWVALWGGGKVVRVSPQGQVTAEVKVPTRCPTAVAFAGEDIYITSEAEQEPDKYPENLAHHGKVFKSHVGVRGRPTNIARVKV